MFRRTSAKLFCVVTTLAVGLTLLIIDPFSVSGRDWLRLFRSSEEFAASVSGLDAIHFLAFSNGTDETCAVLQGGHKALVPKLHILTVQTVSTPGWCRLLLSAFLTNSTIVIHTLGWGHRYAHRKRPLWLLRWLAAGSQRGDIREDDIVLFSDGSDVVFSGVDPQRALEVMRTSTASSEEQWRQTAGEQNVRLESEKVKSRERLNATQWPSGLPPVLFNAEANCYLPQTFRGVWGAKKGRCLSAYRRFHLLPQPYLASGPNASNARLRKARYLNAGAWIGRVWAVRRLFSLVHQLFAAQPHRWCDQSILGGFFLQGRERGLFSLDWDNQIFLATYHVTESDFCPKNRVSLTMCHSGQAPLLLHFNGRATRDSTLLSKTSWFSKWDANHSKAFRRDGRVCLDSLRGNPQLTSISQVCSEAQLPDMQFPTDQKV